MKAETEKIIRVAINCDTTIPATVRDAAITTLRGESVKGIGRTLTYGEAAKAIHRSISTVQVLIAKGILKTVKSSGMKRARGISEESVRRMMKGEMA